TTCDFNKRNRLKISHGLALKLKIWHYLVLSLLQINMNFVNNSYKTLFLPTTTLFIVILKYSVVSYVDSRFCNDKH
uniref:Uncharacterized protein n=1 Tax=Glossina palpalis gambiensis TaxID=67801 RepID=A0A1B0B4H5_9MUSC